MIGMRTLLSLSTSVISILDDIPPPDFRPKPWEQHHPNNPAKATRRKKIKAARKQKRNK